MDIVSRTAYEILRAQTAEKNLHDPKIATPAHLTACREAVAAFDAAMAARPLPIRPGHVPDYYIVDMCFDMEMAAKHGIGIRAWRLEAVRAATDRLRG